MAIEQATNERVGLWINKRSLSHMDMPFAHVMSASGDGWRCEVRERSELVLTFLSGATQRVPVDAGDEIVGIRDDLYVGLRRREPKRGGA